MPRPMLDHLVVDTREQIDRAAHAYQALGFQLTPRGHHTLGSSNNLAVFENNYLELLGFGQDGAARPELVGFPIGLNGLVFRTGDAVATQAAAQANGSPLAPVQAFSRPVVLDGQSHAASFRTTRFPPNYSGVGRVYFCEHLTPELVWRSEWQAHPNGATAISGILIATDDPSHFIQMFARLFGTAIAHPSATVLELEDRVRIELRPIQDVVAMLGDAAPDPAERDSFIAAIMLRAASLNAIGRIAGVRTEPHRVIVPAMLAFNTTLIFEV